MSKKLKWDGKGSIKGAMKIDLTLLCLAAAAVFCLSAPTFAQDEQKKAFSNPGQPGNAARVQELQRIIEAQQRQLDKQQKQLEGQSKTLQELRQQVQGLARGEAPPEAPAAEKPEASRWDLVQLNPSSYRAWETPITSTQTGVLVKTTIHTSIFPTITIDQCTMGIRERCIIHSRDIGTM